MFHARLTDRRVVVAALVLWTGAVGVRLFLGSEIEMGGCGMLVWSNGIPDWCREELRAAADRAFVARDLPFLALGVAGYAAIVGAALVARRARRHGLPLGHAPGD